MNVSGTSLSEVARLSLPASIQPRAALTVKFAGDELALIFALGLIFLYGFEPSAKLVQLKRTTSSNTLRHCGWLVSGEVLSTCHRLPVLNAR